MRVHWRLGRSLECRDMGLGSVHQDRHLKPRGEGRSWRRGGHGPTGYCQLGSQVEGQRKAAEEWPVQLEENWGTMTWKTGVVWLAGCRVTAPCGRAERGQGCPTLALCVARVGEGQGDGPT